VEPEVSEEAGLEAGLELALPGEGEVAEGGLPERCEGALAWLSRQAWRAVGWRWLEALREALPEAWRVRGEDRKEGRGGVLEEPVLIKTALLRGAEPDLCG
jgi:hypothetical protein